MLSGTVFDPSDEEIVSHYLPKLIQGESMGEWQYLIEFEDIYSTKPSLLFDINSGKGLTFIKSNQRLFFSHRQKISQWNANGKRPKRVVESQGDGNGSGGYWKSSTGEKPIVDERQEDTVLGYVNTLNFLEFKNEKRSRQDATKTSWLMYEYCLPGEKFQEWVICKIKDLSRSEHDEYESVWLDELFRTLSLSQPQGQSNDQDHHLPKLLECGSQASTLIYPLMDNNIVDGSSCLMQSKSTFVGESGQFDFSVGCGLGQLESNAMASNGVGEIMSNDEDDPFKLEQLLEISNSKSNEISKLLDEPSTLH